MRKIRLLSVAASCLGLAVMLAGDLASAQVPPYAELGDIRKLHFGEAPKAFELSEADFKISEIRREIEDECSNAASVIAHVLASTSGEEPIAEGSNRRDKLIVSFRARLESKVEQLKHELAKQEATIQTRDEQRGHEDFVIAACPEVAPNSYVQQSHANKLGDAL